MRKFLLIPLLLGLTAPTAQANPFTSQVASLSPAATILRVSTPMMITEGMGKNMPPKSRASVIDPTETPTDPASGKRTLERALVKLELYLSLTAGLPDASHNARRVAVQQAVDYLRTLLAVN